MFNNYIKYTLTKNNYFIIQWIAIENPKDKKL